MKNIRWKEDNRKGKSEKVTKAEKDYWKGEEGKKKD